MTPQQKTEDWEIKIRQIFGNVKDKDKPKKIINLFRQLLSSRDSSWLKKMENEIKMIGMCADVKMPMDSSIAMRSGRIVDERMSETGEKEYLVDNLIRKEWFFESQLRIY